MYSLGLARRARIRNYCVPDMRCCLVPSRHAWSIALCCCFCPRPQEASFFLLFVFLSCIPTECRPQDIAIDAGVGTPSSRGPPLPCRTVRRAGPHKWAETPPPWLSLLGTKHAYLLRTSYIGHFSSAAWAQMQAQGAASRAKLTEAALRPLQLRSSGCCMCAVSVIMCCPPRAAAAARTRAARSTIIPLMPFVNQHNPTGRVGGPVACRLGVLLRLLLSTLASSSCIV